MLNENKEKQWRTLSPPCRKKPPWGRSHTNLFSWMTWSWVIDLLKVGKQRELVEDDIDDLNTADTSKQLLHDFLQAWNNELVKNGRNANLYIAILHTIGVKRYGWICFTLCFYNIAQIASVVCLQEILKFVENPDGSVSYESALGYCGGIGICALFLAFHHHWVFYNTTRVGVNIRQVMTAAILYKTLFISPNSVPSAQVMNLMSTDSQRFQELLKMLPMPFAGVPFVILGIIFLCYRINSWYPLLGLVLMVSIVPIQVSFAKKFGKLRDQAVEYTDQRLKLINEVLVGCLAMKMYCWEAPLLSSVSNARTKEMKYITRAALIKAFNLATFFSSQALIALVIFLPYFYTQGKLEPSVVYPTLTFFALFKFPILLFIPFLVQLGSEIRVSIFRIKQFLLMPEISKNRILASNSPFDLENVKKLDPTKFATYYGPKRTESTVALITSTTVTSLKANKPDNQGNDENNEKNKQEAPCIIINDANFSWDAIPDVPLKRVLTSKKKGKSNESQKLERVPTHASQQNVLLIDKDDQTRHELSNISINIETNKLYAIVGKIGSGKSSLLSAILGELPFDNQDNSNDNDKMCIHGSIAYASQKTWIFSASVRDNILFGKKYDREWYKKCVESSSLVADFAQFPHSDQTIIGERGINLSGGQKARIGLARAIYAKADILLLDDPLSAVDSVVAKHIFDNVLDSKHGICRTSIRVLVTHQTQFLNRVDCVCIMENGRISHQDSLENLNKGGINIKSLIDDKMDGGGNNVDMIDSEMKQVNDDNDGNNNENNDSSEKEEEEDNDKINESFLNSTAVTVHVSNLTKLQDDEKSMVSKAHKEAIVKKEEMVQGNVSLETYMSLFHIKGSQSMSNKKVIFWQSVQCIGLLFLMFSAQLAMTASEYWLGIWANESKTEQESSKYVIIYLIFVACTLILSILRALTFFLVILRGARILHDMAFNGVLYSPMAFFETNPIGRILNRFSKDQWILDEMLPFTGFDALQTVAYCAMAVLTAGLASPYVLLLVIPCLLIFVWTVRMFLSSSRVMKRLDGTTRSPIFALFGIIYSGLGSIRAYKNESMMLERGLQMIDINSRISLMFEAISRWLGFTLDMMAMCLTTSTAFLCVYLAHATNFQSSAVGLVLTYMISLSAALQWAVRQSAELENYMTSTERIVEYKKLKSEQDIANDINDQKNKKKDDKNESNNNNKLDVVTTAPDNWPSNGNIRLVNLYARYREHLDYVLKNLMIDIEAGCKIGIVGRTGSGKSSLFLTFYRLLEPCDGHIEIDGCNLSNLTLSRVRNSLSIIPQDPVLFSETIRYNIDPFNNYSDEEIIDVLSIVKLDKMILSLPQGLNTMMREHGSNFSVGEAQLICVARALLKKSKIVLIDEATASVDPNTDSLIQEILRERFKDQTVLTIAHRLQTVLDSDKILVLKSGVVVEFDTPQNLLAKDVNNDDTAVFASMYQQAMQATKKTA